MTRLEGRKMRIAVWHNLPSGGGKRALYHHVKGLVERGHHVEVWYPSTADQSYLPLNTLAQEHMVPLDWQYASGAEEVLRYYRRLRNNLRALGSHCRICGEQIEEGGFDILFANSCMFVRTSPIGRYVTIPKVLYLQEPYRWLYEALPRLPWPAIPDPKRYWWSPRYLRWFLRDLVSVQAHRLQLREELDSAETFDRILVNSNFSRESILRAYGIDAETCYLGIDAQRFRDMGLARQGFLLSIGSITREKNVDFLLRAIGSMSEPRPLLVLVANVVNSHYFAELERLANSLGIKLLLKILVSDEELLTLYCTASVLVYAPRLEPFGYASLEASACGLPVVAVAEGGVRETVIHGVNGYLVDSDPDQMASTIKYLFDNPSKAMQLGQNGQRIVRERWSLEAAIDRLERNLHEILSLGKTSTG